MERRFPPGLQVLLRKVERKRDDGWEGALKHPSQ